MKTVATGSVRALIVKARVKLRMTQSEMAAAVGTSVRTLSRWEGGESAPADFHLHKLAKILHPIDPPLAQDAATWSGRTLEDLGIVTPAPAPPPTPSSPPAPSPRAAASREFPPVRLLVDAVVCAVAAALERLDGAPVPLARARAAVAAAFTSARDLGLGVDEAADAFASRPALPGPLRSRPPR